jgi:rod shape-determining protein MreD
MTIVFYICVSLALVVLQTVAVPNVPALHNLFDVTAIFIIYLGLLRGFREGLPVVLLLGLTLDHLSGAPFLVFTTSYFWLFIGVRWLTRILQVGMRFRLALIVGAGILLQNTVFIICFEGVGALDQVSSVVLGTILPRLLWALILGPILVLVFERARKSWDRRVSAILVHGSNPVNGRTVG